ncbi:MAG: hypothetical protein A2Y74_06835 [Actinobacteria bacterium RBG_13_63_9]|nr:MAG: hypothetical protein A2Y74_06835 [Actinobacteria bacterium RBG_13_63_9]
MRRDNGHVERLWSRTLESAEYAWEELLDFLREVLAIETETKFGRWNLGGVLAISLLILVFSFGGTSPSFHPWPEVQTPSSSTLPAIIAVVIAFGWCAWLVQRDIERRRWGARMYPRGDSELMRRRQKH